MKRSTLLQHLRRHGCYFKREGRAHSLWSNPATGGSGFISRDNPDPTARNIRQLLAEAGIPREESVLWNVVPWYIGTGAKIRAARSSDIAEGAAYVARLLTLLPKLAAVVLLGRKAQRTQGKVASLTRARLFATLHPSNQVVTCWPAKREQLQDELRAVAAFISALGSS